MERSIDSLKRVAVARGLSEGQLNRLLALLLAVRLEEMLEQGVREPMVRREILHNWLDDVLFEVEEARGGI